MFTFRSLPCQQDSLVVISAGVADEDMLDEFLVGRRQLDHGQSSTMDVRRQVKWTVVLNVD